MVLSAFVGTSIEWYDFFLFGSAAALVFPMVFFPESDPQTAILLSFMTYGVAFLARPLGGVIFGRMGDAIGRKTVLVVTLSITGGGTFLIGCIPSYDAIGVWAPLLLVLMRLVQGLGIGGEWGGAVTLSAEHAEAGGRGDARGLLTSAVQLGVPVGNLFAVGALAVMSATLPEEQFVSWGWRIPFIASALLVVLGLWIRVAVDESPLFAEQDQVEAPFREMLRTHWRQILLTIGLRVASDVSYYVFAVFALSYLVSTLEMNSSVGLYGVIAGSVAQLLIIPMSAALSDHYGRRPVYVVGAVSVGVWAFVAWPLINTANPALVITTIAIGIAAQGIMFGPLAAFVAEMFSTKVRNSGSSFGFQIAGVFGGAIAPFTAQLLLTSFGSTSAVSIYVALMAALAVVSAYLARETHKNAIGD
ncbi:MFS transporter [Aeromicrobium sp. CTD01-1L150]|uniref:MFS transporter n=1 Tax=Aeromicrobium sp. CTD01-1L150 TaxID=3341830 RepID=UPI0035C1EB8E